MKPLLLYILVLLVNLFTFQSEALVRDFNRFYRFGDCVRLYSSEHETYFCHDCVEFFSYFGKKNLWNEIDVHLHLIPTCKGKLCERCCFFDRKNEGIFAPYVTWKSKDNFEFLKDHLIYCAQNNSCQCYWPEKSPEAGVISDRAYKLFMDLFDTTALSILVTNEQEQKRMLESRPSNAYRFSNKGLVTALINKCFFYSHFHRIFQDLSQYSKLKFNESQYSEIQLKIDNISEELTILFSKLYQSCSLKHKNHRISQESRFISQLFLFDFSCKNLSIPHHKIREMQSLTDFNAVLQTELDFIPETEEMFKLKTNKIVFQKNFPNEYGTTSNDFFVQQESNAARTDEAAQISWLKMEYT